MSETDEQAEIVETDEQVESPETVPVDQAEFEEAVAQGRELAAAIGSNKMGLGALADRVDTRFRYGEATLERFAERIDVLYGTLKRYRSIYRAWKDIDFGATSPSFSVLSSLAAVENRAELIRANPEMTAVQARDIAREDSLAKARAIDSAMNERAASERADKAANATNPTDSVAGDIPDSAEEEEAEAAEDEDDADAEADEDDPEWQAGETRRWAGVAATDAVKAYKLYGESAQKHLVPARLRAVDELERLIAALRKGGGAMTSLADKMEAISANPPPDDASA